MCESNKEVELVNWQVNLGVLGCQAPAKAGFWQYRKTFIITINLRCRIAHNNLSIKFWQKNTEKPDQFLIVSGDWLRTTKDFGQQIWNIQRLKSLWRFTNEESGCSPEQISHRAW